MFFEFYYYYIKLYNLLNINFMIGGIILRNSKVFILTMCAMGIAINVVFGTLVTRLQIPLIFLDTIGTIFIAVLFGPWEGAIVGALTNVLTPILSGNPKDIPFLLVNVAVGLIVGYVARRFKFTFITAGLTGLLLAIICPLIGSPIAVWIYGGITGSGNDFIFVWLKHTGLDVFQAAFIPRITGNFIDKIGSCLLVFASMKYIPSQYKSLNFKSKG
jgi:energy-coupling factor transport system substrate-specific component